MQEHRELLLSVWREVSRHLDIQGSALSVAQLLQEKVPLQRLVVRIFEPRNGYVQTVAVGSDPVSTSSLGGSTPCSETDKALAEQWYCDGRLVHGWAETSSLPGAAILMPPELQDDFIAGPIGQGGHIIGVVVVEARPGEMFQEQHLAFVRLLLEPFAVALENDQRLHEILALREAAEADKRSLLNRLGRKALGDVIVGAESGLQTVMQRVELVAASDVPVLILGETGTGKELIVRALHRCSQRADGPIIRVNCGAMPHELIDSQLFGHERGAFTGATETRRGWFEQADGGTLFLDEIGELTLPAQVRLLRILQDGWLDRIGGRQPIHVDVRVVAATNSNLPDMVAQGTFREDLWYRIAVFPILLPPLRDRIQDIPVLACHFAERAAIRFGLALQLPTKDDLKLLAGYSWPGNIRELGTVIDRAAILGNGKHLDVTKALGSMNVAAMPSMSAQILTNLSSTTSSFLSLDEAMRMYIEETLRRTHGRIEGSSGAAALLHINPHTLRARMRKLRIDWKIFRNAIEMNG